MKPRTVKPLMYGYMKVEPGTPDNDVRQMELVLQDYAEAEGYCFATIFYEEGSGSTAAFSELVEELKRSEAHDVIAPTAEHIAIHPLLFDQRITRLQDEADASLHLLSDRT